MKIIHIWNQAGVSSILAKWQRKQGHTVTVLQQKKHDPLGISKYYNDKIIRGKYWFVIHALCECKKYDIIHLHDAWFMILPIRLFYKNKKIILHYHGSLVRDNTLGKFRLLLERLVNKILVATPDLIDHDYMITPYYLPDPVDTDLFVNKDIPKNNRCFSVLKLGTDKNTLEKILKKHGFDFELEVQKRNRHLKHMIPYKEFADKLSNYEYYADIPIINDKIIHAHSMCGLQALSMGLKVIDSHMKIKHGLPDCHKPQYVVNILEKIYNG